MEFPLPYPISSSAILVLILLFLLSLLWISKNIAKKKRGPPKAAGAWPILGHLPLLGGPEPPHIILGNMAAKYGPLFAVKLGVHPAVVVSSWDMAKECLTTHDKTFANRPNYLAAEILAYDYAMFGFSPYGSYWRQVRKVTTLELLSNHRLELLKHVRESEVKACTKHVYDLWEQNRGSSDKVLVDMKRWFGDVTSNVMFRMVLGKRFQLGLVCEMEESERFRNALREFFKLSGEFVISDAVLFLRWLDLGGHEKAMKKTAKEIDDVIQGWLEGHKQKRINTNSYANVNGEHDFMDMMLSALDSSSEGFGGLARADTINKATCMALILGGTDTTTVTLTWALSLLLNNRESLRKVQDELNIHVGRDRQVKESDVKNLVYLQAIIKETLRLYPAAPLALPHESMEDCTVSNYHVPAGTRLIFNLSKIQRDPNIWPDPSKFQPERFLTTQKDFDVRGQKFEFIPFGSGRRICPGISFALQVMQLTLAQLLHGFEIATPSDEPVDMGETSGLTNMKATPLEVLVTPRFHAKVYQDVDSISDSAGNNLKMLKMKIFTK